MQYIFSKLLFIVIYFVLNIYDTFTFILSQLLLFYLVWNIFCIHHIYFSKFLKEIYEFIECSVC